MSSNDSTLKTGVYKWTNGLNGKSYVGSASRSLILRERVHRSSLRGNYHGNRHFQAAWNKYGEAAFTFEVIERCPPEQCLEREQHWIDALRSADPKFGYNLDPKAGSNLGYRFTPDQKAKVSAALKGRVFSEGHRTSLSESRKGMKFSQEHRDNIGRSKKGHHYNLGRKLTPEQRAKCAKGRLGKEPWNKGVELSNDHCAKLAEKRRKRKGQKLTEQDVLEIKRVAASGVPHHELARRFKVSTCYISNIVAGRCWKWVVGP